MLFAIDADVFENIFMPISLFFAPLHTVDYASCFSPLLILR